MTLSKTRVGAIFAAILLVSIVFIPTVMAQAESSSLTSNATENMKVTKLPKTELKVININDTSNIVQVDNVLINFESNPEYTEAQIQIENLTTNEVEKFNYKTTELDGKFKTNVYQGKKLVNTVTSIYNPLAPSSTKEILDNSTTKQSIMSSKTRTTASTTKYWWDNVRFIKGSGIKYHHPDYSSYNAYHYESFYINGNKLTHYHLDDSWSGAVAALAPAAIGAAVGAKIGGALGAAAGTVLGGLMGGQSGSVLVDEQGCIWYWVAKTWKTYINGTLPVVYPVYLPQYCRVSTYTLWNYLGLSAP
ncbi:hypothetical protein [Methanosarcina sp.]|uniref:hypothetical protein n=1 Tax=Methanosarcina sp. TaxID=2213 RepID=UPI002988CBD6|nr:hypothetical protein [Methanosarcina sp.]MDW5549487.1 hypothetical protein [Methanosarcina sp.]MDW5553521.1 hypothetical protein [Methanosarcina sp.]MDW5558675.1 hypothetical protein [Methanosarcina sp.]